jgi:hypothetical protein
MTSALGDRCGAGSAADRGRGEVKRFPAPSPSPEAAPPSASDEDITQAKELLLSWMQTRPADTYQSSIQATEFRRLTEIIAQFGCDIRDAARQAGVRAGREQAARWCDSAYKQARSTVTFISSPDDKRKWDLAAQNFATAATAIRRLAPDTEMSANDRIVEQWRKERDAPLTECQASFTDRECVHRKCPVPRGDQQCPLPWNRSFDEI